jgi:hypothetical protein
VSSFADSSVITCALALGVGACGPGNRPDDPFASGSASLSETGVGETGGPGGTSGGSSQSGPESGPDAESGSTEAFKFDLGEENDIAGVTDGMSGEGCKYLDMLFVVDISGSMSEEKENLNANFPTFVQVLDDYVNDPSKGALGYRLGATNSSHQEDGSTTGLDGALVNNGGAFGMDDCGTGGNYWLEGPAAGLASDFPCLANNPRACTNSCTDLGVERPLDTIMGFIDKSAAGDTNDGFYRGEESLLVIVTLTDEDDQSTVSPMEAKQRLDEFTQGEDRYVIVTVSGRENAGCESAFGEASAAPRLHEFTNGVSKGMMGDICEGDLTQALQEALELITFSCDTLPPPEG